MAMMTTLMAGLSTGGVETWVNNAYRLSVYFCDYYILGQILYASSFNRSFVDRRFD